MTGGQRAGHSDGHVVCLLISTKLSHSGLSRSVGQDVSSSITPMNDVSTQPPMQLLLFRALPFSRKYPKTDGIVAWEGCVSAESPQHRGRGREPPEHVHHQEVLRVLVFFRHNDGTWHVFPPAEAARVLCTWRAARCAEGQAMSAHDA